MVAPLQPDAARLDARLPLGDARAVDDDDVRSGSLQSERDGKPDDAGSNDEHVGGAVQRADRRRCAVGSETGVGHDDRQDRTLTHFI